MYEDSGYRLTVDYDSGEGKLETTAWGRFYRERDLYLRLDVINDWIEALTEEYRQVADRARLASLS